MLRTVMRAGAVLDLFTDEEPEWGVTATAARLGIANSMAHDLLVSLARTRLLQRVGHGRYRLGWRTVSLASVLLRTSDLKAKGAAVVQRLAEGTRAGVRLVAWDRGEIVCIERRQPRRRPSAAAAADWGAAPRGLLPGRRNEEVDDLWERGGIFTEHPSLDALRTELDRIRAEGWAREPAGDPGGGLRGGAAGGRPRGRLGGGAGRRSARRRRRRTRARSAGRGRADRSAFPSPDRD